MRKQQLLPPTYLLVSIVAMAALHFLLPVTTIVAVPWTMIGVLPLALGIGINLIADNALRRAQTTVKPFEESTALATSGVYGFSRHPMYLGFVLILIGVAILMGSLMPYVVVIVFAILMELVFVRVEEGMLETKFGGAWREYRQNTRRWI